MTTNPEPRRLFEMISDRLIVGEWQHERDTLDARVPNLSDDEQQRLDLLNQRLIAASEAGLR
jgi:hypothetical protein